MWWGMKSYRIIEEKGALRAEYGIALLKNGAEVARVPKISENRRDIEELAALLNELKIEPCHFEDIIEDYLTDFSV